MEPFPSFDDDLARALREIRKAGLFRTLPGIESANAPRIRIGGVDLANFCSNDYLGLALDPEGIAAARDALERYGAGSGASRLVSGDLPPHRELERDLASFTGREAVLLFNSGYHANTGVLPVLAGEGDLVLSDERNHASLIDGCRLARARVEVYRHGDPDDLRGRLRAARERRRWVITESLFSVDGDLVPLREIAAVAVEGGARLLVDEAHAVGVLGTDGRGGLDACGVPDAAEVLIGTMGKALGSSGAFVAGSFPLRDLLVNRARSLIYSTAIPPASAAAGRAALRRSRDPVLRERLHANRDRLLAELRRREVPVPDVPGGIIPLLVGSNERAIALRDRLLGEGIWCQALRPPTVPDGTARIRLTVTAAHPPESIDAAAESIAAAWHATMSV